MKAASEYTFYRCPNWAVLLQGFFSFLSILLVLIKLATISSTSQSVLTMDPLMIGSWAMMVMATGVNNWMNKSIPADSVSMREGGTL